ncbi:ammonium transporter [Rathayibacter soli]|uniref:ammonium transporter n=1 Tax=Rathayibacter soli TaxID=3144168 RepID=UPI0027E5A744|nr:ammonium transporter [Glaciibacter superstes]
MRFAGAAASAGATSQADTLWLIVATVLALLMAPGVAFFYGGLVRAAGVINMMMMSFGAMAVVGVLWVIYGYGMVFGPDWIPHWLGDPLSEFGLNGIVTASGGIDMHVLALAGFYATFAIDVVALISGAIADRARFGAWLVFAGLWVTFVYFPIARWVFNSTDGWAANAGLSDFAGGTAIHINAGAAALALTLVLGKRHGFKKGIDTPHNVPLTMLGAALLWIGWFGFNAGSEAAVDGVTVLACVNTLVAPAAAILGWLAVEKFREGKSTSVGAASGLVVGLVASAASCNVLTPGWTLVLGGLAGAVCALIVDLRFVLGFDDSLNVVGIHLVGGLIGTLFVGIAGSRIGVLETGSWRQLGVQAGVSLIVMVYSFGVTWTIGTAIQRVMGFRVATHEERVGLDAVAHGEQGYAIGA